ncbi:NACHT domain-containing protein [Paraburkholderia sediminicola]|uniref:NACHT domain-containing protein n=1 Tax=Paraburkholderia sediminicola TaxID=458836 RepID=UPI0038BA47D9
MDPLSTAIATSAVKKPIDDIYGAAVGAVKSLARKWQVAGLADKVCQRIADLERVRTMFSSDLQPLSSFYYPSRVNVTGAAKAPMSIGSLQDFQTTDSVLVTGTLGQGKSMFMRFLCVEEARRGFSIPVFIELRGVDDKISVSGLLKNALQLLGFFEIDDEALDFLFGRGRITIFADGFDELKREYALRVQQEISVLMAKYASTRWVISSRPGSLSAHLQTIPKLKHFHLAPLREDDFEPFLTKLNIPTAQKDNLIAAIKKSHAEIKGVLTTPLMLTLLVETFGTAAGIPTNLHDFYISLFNVMAWRHDDLKPMYQRERATSLSNPDLQAVFETFCFISKEMGVSLNDEQFADVSKKSQKVSGKNFHPEGLKSDLMDGVCLMMRDGLKTAFIHKSIQEFFSAFFIAHNNNNPVIEKVYAGFKKHRLLGWQQEISFLEKIDPFRFMEFFRLPAINATLDAIGYSADGRVSVTKANFHKFFSSLSTYYIKVESGAKSYTLILAAVDSEVVNCVTLEVLTLLPSSGKPLFMPFDELDEYRTDTKFPTTSFLAHCRANPAEEALILRRVREQCTRLDKERAKVSKMLAERKEDIAEILLGQSVSAA